MSKKDRPGTLGILGSAGIFLALGAASILVLVSSCAPRSNHGALQSTRVQVEERNIELEKALAEAEAQGKLRASSNRLNPSHE